MRAQLIVAKPGHDGFKKHFGASPAIILVRPDGYVAFSGSDNSIAKLAKFCDAWLIPRISSGDIENAA
jgi:hypothetical protein